MSHLELIVGNATTRGDGSMTIVALYRKDAKAKPQTVATAVKDPKSGIESLGMDIKNSSDTNRPGQWIKSRVSIPEGSFVEFQVMRTKAGLGAFSSGLAAFVLKARSSGPLYRMAITLPFDQRSTESKGYIEGRFDILNWKTIQKLGINSHRDIDCYKPGSFLNDMVEIERLEKETQSKVQVKASAPTASPGASHGTKTVLKIRRTRRIGTN
jgi:hypothetical protein